MHISNLGVDLLRSEDMCVFFDLGEEISIGNRVYLTLIQLGEVVILWSWKIVHEVASDLFEVHHVLLEVFVSRHKLLVDLVQLCNQRYLQILE